MALNTVTNWFGNIASHLQVIADANSVDDIVAILKRFYDPSLAGAGCRRPSLDRPVRRG